MQQGDLVGLSLLAVYGLGFLCVGTISHRIRFIGNNARTSSGYAWILSYHKLLFAVTILGFGLLLIVQPMHLLSVLLIEGLVQEKGQFVN